MYRIRLHGRGGQGVKTAGRILGSALFDEGFEVQDAPHYGAERRGAPMRATVRAAHRPIHERGAIPDPDLVVVADDTLVPIAAAGVLTGLDEHGVLLIRGEASAQTWRKRLALRGPLIALPDPPGAPLAPRLVGARCAGAAARLLGVVSRTALERAIRAELAGLAEDLLKLDLEVGLGAYEAMAEHEGCVGQGGETRVAAAAKPEWVDVPLDAPEIAAPDIHGAATSVRVRTGLWRTLRPVIDLEHCRGCHWVCSTLCPDGVISVTDDGHPSIDYEHCKGCLVCVAVCPTHAIRAEPEARFREEEAS